MVQQFEHEFLGYGRVPSKCLVRIYSDDGENYICFKDLGIGTSVTNDSENIASQIVNKFNYQPSDCRFFETYDDETFDEITHNWVYSRNKWVAYSPDWVAYSPDWKRNNKIKNLFIS